MTTTRRLVAALALALLLPAASQAQVRSSNGVVVPVGDGFVKLEIVADDVARVAAAKDRAFDRAGTPNLAEGAREMAPADRPARNPL